MGIAGNIARLIAAEHKYKAFPSEVFLLGRQTIHIGEAQARTIFAEEGVAPHEVPIELDRETLEGLHVAKTTGQHYISDRTFFGMLGVKSLRAIDHSDYEGADIVFDLTREIPTKYHGAADLIFDGSVLDNVFSPSEALQNIARLLKPGGRYIGINVATMRSGAYCAFNPYWFFDYFVVNQFKDVRVYVCDFYRYRPDATIANCQVYAIDPRANHRSVIHYKGCPDGLPSLFIIAEKGAASTVDRRTSQGIYRLEEEWQEFDRNLEIVRASKRPFISLRRQSDQGIVGGYGFKYLGNVDSGGLCTRPPINLPTIEAGEIDLLEPFPGYDWGDHQFFEGKRWLSIGDATKESTVLLNLKRGQSYNIELVINPRSDETCVENMQASINDLPLKDPVVLRVAGECRFCARIESAELLDDGQPIRLAFRILEMNGAPTANGLSVSKLRFRPVRSADDSVVVLDAQSMSAAQTDQAVSSHTVRDLETAARNVETGFIDWPTGALAVELIRRAPVIGSILATRVARKLARTLRLQAD